MQDFFVLERWDVKSLTFRSSLWKSVVDQQTDLVYYGKIGYSETDALTPYERGVLYANLVGIKEEEQKHKQAEISASRNRH